MLHMKFLDLAFLFLQIIQTARIAETSKTQQTSLPDLADGSCQTEETMFGVRYTEMSHDSEGQGQSDHFEVNDRQDSSEEDSSSSDNGIVSDNGTDELEKLMDSISTDSDRSIHGDKCSRELNPESNDEMEELLNIIESENKNQAGSGAEEPKDQVKMDGNVNNTPSKQTAIDSSPIKQQRKDPIVELLKDFEASLFTEEELSIIESIKNSSQNIEGQNNGEVVSYTTEEEMKWITGKDFDGLLGF